VEGVAILTKRLKKAVVDGKVSEERED